VTVGGGGPSGPGVAIDGIKGGILCRQSIHQVANQLDSTEIINCFNYWIAEGCVKRRCRSDEVAVKKNFIYST
jgi:hypothetical protein